MKHLTTYKIFEAKMEKVLYHGSPYMFSKFKPTTTFFSDTEKFALEYAETKAMDYAIDNEANVYKVKVKTELFDINNEEDFKLLEKELPDNVEVFLTNFPMGTEISKKEVLTRMRGYAMSEPDEKAMKARVGDEIQFGPESSERYKVYKVDNDSVYTYPLRNYDYILDSVFNEDSGDWSNRMAYDKYFKFFKSTIEFIKNYIENNTDERYPFGYIIDRYANLFKKGDDSIDNKYLNTFKKLYTKAINDLNNLMIKDYSVEFSKKVERVELDSTWRFFETRAVEDIINKHGYGGYVAKEDGVNTYAIFHPEKDVEILSYQFPKGMEFKDIEDYKKYMDLLEYSRTINKSVYRGDVYKWFKKGLSKEEAGKEALRDVKIEKEYWSLIKGGMDAKEAKEKAEKSLTEMKLYESLEPVTPGDFYELFNTLVYIDDIDPYGDEWRVVMRKGNGDERIYIGSRSDIMNDFIETDRWFELKGIPKPDESKLTYDIVYYVGNRKIETLKTNIPKKLAYPLRGKLARDPRYKSGRVKLEKNK